MTQYLILLLVMLGVFAAGAFIFKLPIGVAMASSAVVGTLLAGEGLPVRHFVEGTFGYFDMALIIAMAMIFMKSIQASGLLHTLANKIILKLSGRPILLILAVMFLIMFPGMISGSSTAAVLTTGALVAPVLISVGIPFNRTGAIIAMGGILGMLAPPINIPVMIIGGGIDMPYVGFELPLMLISFPLAIVISLLLSYKYLKDFDIENMKEELPASYHDEYGFKIYLPLIILLVLLVGEKSLPVVFPNMGLPLIFGISSIFAPFTGKTFNYLKKAKEALHDSLGILGILMGVGMFIQIITLIGVRGYIVNIAVGLPALLFYMGMAIGMPLFGAFSAFGSASVLGVPFILALVGADEIMAGSALSLFAGLGDLMPPTALAGMFAAQVVGQKNYFKVLRHCYLPAGLTIVWGLFIILNANRFAEIFKPPLGFLYLLIALIILTVVFTFGLKFYYSLTNKEGE
ncbi:MAG: TRAP transporter large permease subunit [Halanaerobiales bacterium]